VLSTTPALDTDPLTATQTAALVQGIDVLAQRLTQMQTTGMFGDEAAALGESLGTLSPIGDQLRTGLAERLSSLSGAVTVLDVKNAFTKAATDDPVLSISAVTATRETLGDQTRLWFSVPLAGTTALPHYQLSLGQTPSTTATPSLLDEGLKLGNVKTTPQLSVVSQRDLVAAFPAGSKLNYTWKQLGGEPVTLADATTAKPSFATKEPANAKNFEVPFELTVGDGTTTKTFQATAEVDVESPGSARRTWVFLLLTIAGLVAITAIGARRWKAEGRDLDGKLPANV
jgi:hypothetical protein